MASVSVKTVTATPASGAVSVEATVVSIDDPNSSTAAPTAEPTAQEVTAVPTTAVHAVAIPAVFGGRSGNDGGNRQTLDMENGHNITVNGQALNDWEIVVLHYRYSVQIFTIFDFILQLLMFIGEVNYQAGGVPVEENDDPDCCEELPERSWMYIAETKQQGYLRSTTTNSFTKQFDNSTYYASARTILITRPNTWRLVTWVDGECNI